MSVNRFDDLCDKLDSAVFNGDWLFDAENRAIFEEYLRRWDTELKSHGSASENNSDYAALLARHNALREAVVKFFKVDNEILSVNLREAHDSWNEEIAPRWKAARAEVDRLIANEGSADCEGE